MAHCLAILNDKAGGYSSETLRQVLQENFEMLDDASEHQLSFYSSPSAEVFQAQFPQLIRDVDMVMAVGGDGTVIQVITALIENKSLLPLAIMPLGTGNRLAANLGLPFQIKEALKVAFLQHTRPIDIGRINDHYFALMAGAGLDADIMAAVQPLEKKTFGLFSYFIQGLLRTFWSPHAIFDIEADGSSYRARGIGVVVANAGNLLGNYFTLTPGAQPDDGFFDVCILGTRHTQDYLTAMVQILLQQKKMASPRGARISKHKGLQHIRAQKITIQSHPKVKIQADGDVIGMTPVTIRALPEQIDICVPLPHNQPLSDPMSLFQEQLRLSLLDLFKSRP
jgi:diacylglycerol kinase (ATP)